MKYLKHLKNSNDGAFLQATSPSKITRLGRTEEEITKITITDKEHAQKMPKAKTAQKFSDHPQEARREKLIAKCPASTASKQLRLAPNAELNSMKIREAKSVGVRLLNWTVL